MPIRSRYLPDLIDIVRAGTITGPYGDEDLDWTNPTVRTAVPAIVQPASQEEKFDEARNALVDTYRVLTNEADISGYDRIVWPSATGGTYEVMGDAAEYSTPISGFDHSEFTIRTVEG